MTEHSEFNEDMELKLREFILSFPRDQRSLVCQHMIAFGAFSKVYLDGVNDTLNWLAGAHRATEGLDATSEVFRTGMAYLDGDQK